MSHDELLEELAREHLYRNVLVVAAAGGIASVVRSILFTVGQLGVSRGRDRSSLGLVRAAGRDVQVQCRSDKPYPISIAARSL